MHRKSSGFCSRCKRKLNTARKESFYTMPLTRYVKRAVAMPNEAWRTELAALKAMEAQAQQTSFKCAVCGKEYKTEKALTEHIAKVHPDTDSPEK